MTSYSNLALLRSNWLILSVFCLVDVEAGELRANDEETSYQSKR